MLSRDIDVDPNDSSTAPLRWTSLSAPRRERAFSGLSGDALATRFLSWEGLSGKGYVFTVYTAADCPAFCDAVVIAAGRDETGRRRVLDLFDTGPFPEPALDRARGDLGRKREPLEFHVHLLSRSPTERRATLADLSAALFPCGR